MLLTIISLSALSHGQEKGSIEVGGGIGGSISSILNFDSESSVRFGYSFQACGEYYFSDRWGLRAKVEYFQKGTTDFSTNDFGLTRFETDLKLDYLTVPVMMGFHWKGLYLNAGLYAGFAISAERGTGNQTRVISDFVRPLDYGLVSGAGYKGRINDSLMFYIETSQQIGVAEIFEEQINDSFSINFMNALSVGVLIGIN